MRWLPKSAGLDYTVRTCRDLRGPGRRLINNLSKRLLTHESV